ncbi:MAG: acylphosphatase [Candidatus Aenigmatarchaeota archaeon]|nr:MAG: acylphosphatase [Candidatus Aenigmarchaeota archaeon]
MNARVHLLISGQVQGVFFRANTRHAANELGVKGWVRNLPDGMVEVVAEGRKPVLDRFIEYCRKGPEGSKVENIEIEWGEFRNEFGGFEVKF